MFDFTKLTDAQLNSELERANEEYCERGRTLACIKNELRRRHEEKVVSKIEIIRERLSKNEATVVIRKSNTGTPINLTIIFHADARVSHSAVSCTRISYLIGRDEDPYFSCYKTDLSIDSFKDLVNNIEKYNIYFIPNIMENTKLFVDLLQWRIDGINIAEYVSHLEKLEKV